ncbi:stage III sporulation protein AA [Calderihabitans maritimus]|uniref:Stage III sporulation protein AA n=1 Tax=Calderihabitans maritimus TaxID=1246530 RepID=A0A1Z5HXR6_9FIRM|nr:stage III sporulation protein AA [Calderihabitans maritimus]GAW94157.1 stage III sporulation protein AA [Calderihabitans maritimus]
MRIVPLVGENDSAGKIASQVKEAFSVLSPRVRQMVEKLPSVVLSKVEEIRLRQDRPLLLQTFEGEIAVGPSGISTMEEAYRATADDLQRTLQVISQSSVYALEEEFRNGYITVEGGHRIGFVGRAVIRDGRIHSLKFISSINIRVARQVRGCADRVMSYLIDMSSKRPLHTLIISPPRCGKTTLLRDIIRQFSTGVPSLSLAGVNVGLVDERSEIAGCFRGVPQLDVGPRTDVLDACPKSEGMIMLVRSMSPQIVATDELGRLGEMEAVEEMLNAGISLITTVHGRDHKSLSNRPQLKKLMERGIFDRYVILSRSRGVGTIEAIIDGNNGKPLISQSFLARPRGGEYD